MDLVDVRIKLLDNFQSSCLQLFKSETRKASPDVCSIGQFALVRERIAGEVPEGRNLLDYLDDVEGKLRVSLDFQPINACLQAIFVYYRQTYAHD